MKSIDLRNLNNIGEFITATAVVMDGTKELFTREVKARSKEELDGTLANILEIANKVESDFKAVSEGKWVPPVKEEVVPEPEPEKTAEELAADAWLGKWNDFVAAEKAMAALTRNGIEPTAEEQAGFNALKTWVADNRKPEYSKLIANTI
jgi:hypothetical protein